MKTFLKKEWLIITGVFIGISIIFYGYIYATSHDGLTSVYRNWDGPSYVVVAKSFYDQSIIDKVDVIGLHQYYYAAHFPLYPLIIRLFSSLGYFQSSILVSLLFTLLSAIALYELAVKLKTKNALILALVFLIFTPRWFVVSHTGSSEPLFLFFLINVISNLISLRHSSATIWACLAQLTRPQGILIFVGLLLLTIWQYLKHELSLHKAIRLSILYLAIPLTLLSVFGLYLVRYGNFWAFFAAIKDYGHLGIPYRIFHDFRESAIIFPLEIMIFDYLLYGIAVFRLFAKRKIVLATIALPFLIPLPLLSHLDVSRYAIPIIPAMLISYHDIITKKYVQLALLLVVPAILLYGAAIVFLNQSI